MNDTPRRHFLTSVALSTGGLTISALASETQAQSQTDSTGSVPPDVAQQDSLNAANFVRPTREVIVADLHRCTSSAINVEADRGFRARRSTARRAALEDELGPHHPTRRQRLLSPPSAGVHVESGLYALIAPAACAVFVPRSFW
jgi:hypothetical protein